MPERFRVLAVEIQRVVSQGQVAELDGVGLGDRAASVVPDELADGEVMVTLSARPRHGAFQHILEFAHGPAHALQSQTNVAGLPAYVKMRARHQGRIRANHRARFQVKRVLHRGGAETRARRGAARTVPGVEPGGLQQTPARQRETEPSTRVHPHPMRGCFRIDCRVPPSGAERFPTL